MRQKKGRSTAPAGAAAKPASEAAPKPKASRRSGPLPPHLTTFLICLGLALGGGLAFSSSLGPGGEFFSMDDGDYVRDNPHLAQGFSAQGVGWAFSTFYRNKWHPLTWISLLLDHDVYGLEPWGYRLTNILWHAANAVLLFLVLKRMTRRLWPSALVAALFALHPLRVESVAWIAERKDVLSGFFWILSMGAYAWWVERPSWPRYLAVAVSFGLGLLCKPMLVTLPFALLLLDFWPLRRFGLAGMPPAPPSFMPFPRLLLEKLPLFALTAAGCAVTIASYPKEEFAALLPLPLRLLNACLACVQYIRFTFWPVDLAPLHVLKPDAFPAAQGWAAAGALAAATVLFLALARRRPYLIVGWLWFLGTLVPTLGLVQVGIQSMADRFTYIPHIGLLLMVVWGLDDLLANRAQRPLLAAAAGATLLACFLLAFAQASLWRSNLALWEHALRSTADNYGAHDNYGLALMAAGRPDDALREFREAIRLAPNWPNGHHHLGLALQERRQWDEAAASFEAAARAAPWQALPYQELGFSLMAQGRMEEALAPLRQAVKLQPEAAQNHVNLGTALLQRGHLQEAARQAEEALKLEPNLAPARRLLAFALAAQNRPAEAEKEFRAALEQAAKERRTDPACLFHLAWTLNAQGRPDEARERYRFSLSRFSKWPAEARREAWRLATHPDALQRNGALAVLKAETASQALEDRDAETLDALAAAYAEEKRYSEAQAIAKKAILLAAERKTLAEAIQARLQLYQKNQPYREAPR